jgi:hypothetical protein
VTAVTLIALQLLTSTVNHKICFSGKITPRCTSPAAAAVSEGSVADLLTLLGRTVFYIIRENSANLL